MTGVRAHFVVGYNEESVRRYAQQLMCKNLNYSSERNKITS